MAGQEDNPIIPSADKRGKRDPIAAALRRLHDETLAEPLPPEFLDLLAQIDEQRGTKK